MKHAEYELQKQVCTYLKMQYPHVMFLSDTVANLSLTMMQATRNKAIQKPGFKCPDLIILHPNKKHKGLFLELKTRSPYQKNGKLYKSEHLEGQQLTMDRLNNIGYFATFSTGFEHSKDFIDRYMKDLI